MRLYNYTKSLTPDEKEAWDKYRGNEGKLSSGDMLEAMRVQSSLRDKYRAIRHLLTRWPDNYIDVDVIPKDLESECRNFRTILNAAHDERPMQRYLTDNPFIIGSLMAGTNSGHHATYVFPEFQLGNQLRPDFVISGKNSQGYIWICVELQSPMGPILNVNGTDAPQAREGLKQIRDWRSWFRENLQYARTTLDMEGIHEARTKYVLVIGRRSDFDERTNRWRDDVVADNPWLEIISYDRLESYFSRVIETGYF